MRTVAERDANMLIVKGGDMKRVEAYLPDNYIALVESEEGEVLVIGYDHAGWTAEDYVIPRLASGLMFAEVVAGGTISVVELGPGDTGTDMTLDV